MKHRRASASTFVQDVRSWPQTLLAYRQPNHARSIIELVITFVPLVGLWAISWAAIHLGYWWASPPIAVLAAGFLLRLFMIQHDCGHGAFFRQRVANDWVGRVLGVLTLTPYDFWRQTHASHHASQGNLDRRGVGDIDTLTVNEYRSRSAWGRLAYRIYRHPLVMFGIGPTYLFVLRHRLPIGLMRTGWRRWISVMATNLAIAAFVALLIWLIGLGEFLLVHVPITLLAASIGVWLFYVQHQFENTSWDNNAEWSIQDATSTAARSTICRQCCAGSPRTSACTTCTTLSSRIPYYRLPRVLRDHPELRNISRLSLLESFRCVRFVLWDENRRRLVSFREARGNT